MTKTDEIAVGGLDNQEGVSAKFDDARVDVDATDSDESKNNVPRADYSSGGWTQKGFCFFGN